jgi:hypothetical protein
METAGFQTGPILFRTPSSGIAAESATLKTLKTAYMKTTIENTPGSDCQERLVRDLTGITPRKRGKILRMMERLQEELADNGMIVFCGGCNDDAILVHEETGISLGVAHGYGVWMGGDWDERYHHGLSYNPNVSRTAGNFANKEI